MTFNFIGVIVPLSILLPFFIALIRWRYLSPEARFVFLYLLVSAIINITAAIVGKVFHRNNMPLVHILTVAELIIFLLYYRKLLGGKKRTRLYVALAFAFVAFAVANALFLQSIYAYSSYTRSVEAFICMLFALNFFAKLASGNLPAGKILRMPDFYFNVGIFLYFSGAFMLFIFSNFIITTLSKTNFFIIWNIHGSLVLLMYLLFSAGFILCKK